EVRPEYERNSPRMSSNSYVNLKIATCLVRYADDRLIDQRFLSDARPMCRSAPTAPSSSLHAAARPPFATASMQSRARSVVYPPFSP
ncbi:hypothetical protein, partial [Burkholderia multivorans]|uniref:hypothetical protein n=1 Tax=Burkholderia multivorans TaxID=87883 RepID=UPI001C217E82